MGNGTGAAEVAEVEGAGVDTGHGVVIAGEEGIELVVVAASAAEGEAEEGSGSGVNLLVHYVVDHLDAVLLGEGLGSEGQEAGGGDAFLPFFGGGGGQEVARDLLFDEAVEGEVGVEGLDDVVAVAEGVGVDVVLVHAGGIGETGDVEPVPTPAFAVLGRGEEAVDDFGKALGGVVGEKGRDFVGGGREAGQVVCGAAQEGEFLRGRGGGEVFFLQFGEDEAVEGGFGPSRVLDGGRGRVLHGLE